MRELLVTSLLGLMMGFIVLVVCFSSFAHATDKEVLCIIGEAESEGYNGMLAVGEAIRNRNTLKGVYGCKSPRVLNHKYNQDTLNKAKLAWKNSATTNVTKGATHWENVKAFGSPYWAKSMVKTILIGNHQFYKE